MTRRLVLLVATAAALAAPASAAAGGFATVGLDSLPEGLAPGEPWTVELTILQHGRTPLDGVKPSVIVEKAGAGERRSFPAQATGEPGMYRATVVFASAGTWSYVVDDGFSQRHTYKPVWIREGKRKQAEKSDAEATGAAGGGPGGGDGEKAGLASGGENAGLSGGGSGGGGPDYLLAAFAAAVAGLVAALGAAALQRRREGPASAGG
jgi:YtkA-like